MEALLRGSWGGALAMIFVEYRGLGWLDLGGGFFGLEATLPPVFLAVLFEGAVRRSCCPV